MRGGERKGDKKRVELLYLFEDVEGDSIDRFHGWVFPGGGAQRASLSTVSYQSVECSHFTLCCTGREVAPHLRGIAEGEFKGANKVVVIGRLSAEVASWLREQIKPFKPSLEVFTLGCISGSFKKSVELDSISNRAEFIECILKRDRAEKVFRDNAAASKAKEIRAIEKKVTAYADWYDGMVEDNGNRWARFFNPAVKNKHIHHGSAGRARAKSILDAIGEDRNHNHVMTLVRGARQQSGYHKHSLRRYLYDAAHPGQDETVNKHPHSLFKGIVSGKTLLLTGDSMEMGGDADVELTDLAGNGGFNSSSEAAKQ
jgi:hypothetical protein